MSLLSGRPDEAPGIEKFFRRSVFDGIGMSDENPL